VGTPTSGVVMCLGHTNTSKYARGSHQMADKTADREDVETPGTNRHYTEKRSRRDHIDGCLSARCGGGAYRRGPLDSLSVGPSSCGSGQGHVSGFFGHGEDGLRCMRSVS
jgi:hypothetical protein